MPVSGKGARAKGHRAERELCALLKDHLGDDINGEPTAIRNLQQTQDGGFDIGGAVSRVAAIEVKSTRKPSWPQFIEQAVSQAGTKQLPIVCYRKPGGGWLHVAILGDTDLAQLIRERLIDA